MYPSSLTRTPLIGAVRWETPSSLFSVLWPGQGCGSSIEWGIWRYRSEVVPVRDTGHVIPLKILVIATWPGQDLYIGDAGTTVI